jgi:ribose transport system substrate-binding protein
LSSASVNAGKEMAAGFTAGAKIVGSEAIVTGPAINDPPQQSQMFKQVTGSAKGGISIQASNAEMIAGQLAEAGKQGVPLVAVDIKPAPTSGVKTLVTGNGRALGRQLADELVKKFPPNAAGTVVLGMPRPGIGVFEERGAGIREALVKLPGVKVLGPFDTQVDAAANLGVWRRLVAATPDALAFVGTGSTDSVSLSALRAQVKGSWLAAAFDLDPKGLQGLKDGQLTALASPEHFLKGAVTGWLLAQHAKTGQPIPEGWIDTPGLLVTPANIDEIVKRQTSEATKLAWFQPQLDKITGNLPAYTKPLDQAR